MPTNSHLRARDIPLPKWRLKIQPRPSTSTHLAAPNHRLGRPPGFLRALLPPARTTGASAGSAGHVRARGVLRSVAPGLNRAESAVPCVATAVAAARSPAHSRIRPPTTTATSCLARRPATAPSYAGALADVTTTCEDRNGAVEHRPARRRRYHAERPRHGVVGEGGDNVFRHVVLSLSHNPHSQRSN